MLGYRRGADGGSRSERHAEAERVVRPKRPLERTGEPVTKDYTAADAHSLTERLLALDDGVLNAR